MLEPHNPLIPTASDVAGIFLTVVVMAAVIAAICLLVCLLVGTCRRGRR